MDANARSRSADVPPARFLILAQTDHPSAIHIFITDRPLNASDHLRREHPAARIFQYIPLNHILAGHIVSSILCNNGSAAHPHPRTNQCARATHTKGASFPSLLEVKP